MVALAGLMVIACAAYIQFGAFPYAVYEAITLSEVMASVSAGSLLVTIVLYGACYGVLLAGFLYLLRHSARFGVIPVARRRRRA